MRTLDLNEEEKSARVKEQNRLRAAKYYASKKNVINDKAKVQRKSKATKTEVVGEIMTLPSKTAYSQKEGKLTIVKDKVKFVRNEPKPVRQSMRSQILNGSKEFSKTPEYLERCRIERQKLDERMEREKKGEVMTLPNKTAHSQKEGKLSSVEEEVKFVPNKPAPPKEMSPRNKAKYNLAMIELQKQQEKEEVKNEEKSEPEEDNSEAYDKIVKQLKTVKYDSQSTLKKYIENFKTIVKLVGINTYSKFIKFIVNEPNKVISILETATHGKGKKAYSLNSIRDYINLIAFYIDKLKIPIDAEDKEVYNDMAAILVAQSHRQTEKNKDKEVPPINEYVENVAKQYGKNSMNHLIVLLLVATYGRDDLNLNVVKSIPQANKDFSLNYLVLEDDKITVIINEFKTSKKYGQKKIVLDDALEQQVRNYIDKKNIEYGELLFPNLRLSQAISAINKKLGYIGDGAINLIRKMVTSDKYLDANITPYEELKIAKNFGHTIQSNNIYKRQVVPAPKYNFV